MTPNDRTVVVYALEHNGRAYIGTALDSAVRLKAHVEGTGATCTRRWIWEIAPELPEFKLIDECPEDDRVLVEQAWISEYVRRGWDMVNVILHVWPLDTGAQRRIGRISIRKVHVINKANGYEAQRRGGRTAARKLNATQEANGWAHQRRVSRIGGRSQPVEAKRRAGLKAAEIHRKNGWAQQRRAGRIGGPIGGRKVAEIHQANGWKHQSEAGRIGALIANHNRWHVNRGIVNPNCELCRGSGAR